MRKRTLFFISLFLLDIYGILLPQSIGRQTTFEWKNVPLRESLDSLMRRYNVSIVYLDRDVESFTVDASCLDCNFEDALNLLLNKTDLVWIGLGSQVIIKRQEKEDNGTYFALCGNVKDSITDQSIVDAFVYVKKQNTRNEKLVVGWSRTNAQGFYSIPKIPHGKYIIFVRAMGYGTVEMEIEKLDEMPLQLDVKVVAKDILMQRVTVEGNPDLHSSVTNLSRGICYRSVPTDQNQYLLDGAKIYNPVHFGGIWSTISNEVTNDVQIMRSGVPPFYGGNIGGIVDFSLRNGSRQHFSSQLGIGTLSSNFLVEAPLLDNSSFIISARKGYQNLAMKIPHFKHDDVSNTGSEELVGKVSSRIASNSQIMLSGYYSKDTYKGGAKSEFEFLQNDFSWKNNLLNLKWLGLLSPSLLLQTSVVF